MLAVIDETECEGYVELSESVWIEIVNRHPPIINVELQGCPYEHGNEASGASNRAPRTSRRAARPCRASAYRDPAPTAPKARWEAARFRPARARAATEVCRDAP